MKNALKLLALLAGVLLLSTACAPKKSSGNLDTVIILGIEGRYTYSDNSQMILDITKSSDGYLYQMQVNNKMYSGKVTIHDSTSITLEDIPVKQYEKETEKINYGIFLMYENGALSFQNRGDPTAYYVIFDDCTEKFVTLAKGAPQTQPQSPTGSGLTTAQTHTPLSDFEIDGTTLAKYTGTETSVIIPNGITHIGEWAFYQKQLTSVTIPNSVISIGGSSFSWNQLTNVIIGNNVISIGDYAFAQNLLTSINIPNSVNSIGIGAFNGNQLTGVTIPNSVVKIGDYAFQNNQLTSVTIPDSITIISSGIFNVNQLTRVTIPNSVVEIGGSAFDENQLASVTIPNSVTTIGVWAFANNQLTNVTIGNSVNYIGNEAFRGNQLTSITIPKSVTIIGDQAFAGNPLNGNVTIPDVSAVEIGNRAFENEYIYMGR